MFEYSIFSPMVLMVLFAVLIGCLRVFRDWEEACWEYIDFLFYHRPGFCYLLWTDKIILDEIGDDLLTVFFYRAIGVNNYFWIFWDFIGWWYACKLSYFSSTGFGIHAFYIPLFTYFKRCINKYFDIVLCTGSNLCTIFLKRTNKCRYYSYSILWEEFRHKSYSSQICFSICLRKSEIFA